MECIVTKVVYLYEETKDLMRSMTKLKMDERVENVDGRKIAVMSY